MNQLAPIQPGNSKALEKWNSELAFRSVVEATSDRSGIEFLKQLVKSLAESLKVQDAFVAAFAGAEDRVRTLAFWSQDDWRTNVEYRLSGTPCDSDLVTLGARSYPRRAASQRTRPDPGPSGRPRLRSNVRIAAGRRDLRSLRQPRAGGAREAPRRGGDANGIS